MIVPAAFLSVIALTIALRGSGAPTLALIALLLLVGELVAFWGFIFPVNQATQNWTALPRQLGDTAQPMGWEYAHAVRAILYVLALGTPLMSVLDWRCGVASAVKQDSLGKKHTVRQVCFTGGGLKAIMAGSNSGCLE